jgi:GNAT superfamily N-acetyltransferase
MLEMDLLQSWNAVLVSSDDTFDLRLLERADLPRIMDLQGTVVQRLSRRDLLQPLSPEFMATHIGAKGFVVGAFALGELVAFCSGYFPDVDDREWNLGHDLGLEDAGDLRTVANLQIICIHPNYRGYGLGVRLSATVIGVIRRLNRYRHLCATISPYNYWSLNVALSCGLVVRNLKMKYGGKLRCIAYQNLLRPAAAMDEQDLVGVRLTDIARLEALLNQGYIGVRVQAIPGRLPAKPLDHAECYELLLAKACPC